MDDLSAVSIRVRDAFKARSQRRVRKANNAIMKAAVLEFSEQMYQLAVYSYVLSKVLSKPRFTGREYSGKLAEIDGLLSRLCKCAARNDKKGFLALLGELKAAIGNIESSDSRYITSMMDKGKLKTAATLYAQGLSLSAASELTGVEKQEIMDYAGKTMMFDRMHEREDTLSKRLNRARNILLGGKA